MEDRQSMDHVKIESITPEKDMLEVLFEKQKLLCERYPFWEKLSQEKSVIVYADYIASEAQELKNEVNWKLHKLHQIKFDRKHIILEYIDLLHMILSGLIKLDVTPLECFQYFLAKNKENNDRIDRGY